MIAAAATVPEWGLIHGVTATPPELTIFSPVEHDSNRYTIGTPPQLRMFGSPARSDVSRPVWIFVYACPRISSMMRSATPLNVTRSRAYAIDLNPTVAV